MYALSYTGTTVDIRKKLLDFAAAFANTCAPSGLDVGDALKLITSGSPWFGSPGLDAVLFLLGAPRALSLACHRGPSGIARMIGWSAA
jgi:hypothetical protein